MGRPPKNHKDDLTTLGGRIRAARRAKGLSADALAHAAQISAGHVFVIERNGVEPTDATLGRIAKALGRSVKWLRDGSAGNGGTK